MALNLCGVEVSTGASLLWKDPADDVYKALGGITAFPQFAFTHGTASCDDDDVANNGWATRFKNGKKDGGSTTIEYNWKVGDVIQDAMYAEFTGIATSEFRMQWSDTGATKLDFAANVNTYNVNTPPGTDEDNKITRSLGVELSGEPVWG